MQKYLFRSELLSPSDGQHTEGAQTGSPSGGHQRAPVRWHRARQSASHPASPAWRRKPWRDELEAGKPTGFFISFQFIWLDFILFFDLNVVTTANTLCSCYCHKLLDLFFFCPPYAKATSRVTVSRCRNIDQRLLIFQSPIRIFLTQHLGYESFYWYATLPLAPSYWIQAAVAIC